jgi:uncharacterized phage protein (TIGR01671 family)
MRQIKFRVWDGDRVRSWGDLERTLDWELIQANHNDWLQSGKEPPQWRFMQYTGLKDANGTEIYEGDIVRFALSTEADIPPVDDAHSLKSRFVVRWGHYGEGTEYEPGESGEIGYGWFTEHDSIASSLTTGWFFTIIGNVHEHPELLEAQAA